MPERRVVRGTPRRERPAAGSCSGDNLWGVSDHGPNQQKQLPGDRCGNAGNERVPVSRGAFAVGVAMNNHVEAGDAVLVG